jgi:outer membrane immunogenic protein
MKRVLFAAVGLMALAGLPAAAADMPVKAPILKAPPVEVWNWTGFYIGGNVGYSWGRSDTDVSYFNPVSGALITPPAGSIVSSKFDMNGVIGGGQIGYNWQSGNWVFGIEADFQGSGQDGDERFTCAATSVSGGVCFPGLTATLPGSLATTGVTLDVTQKLQWFGTARARLGTTMWSPTTLLYVTGGFAYGSVKTTALLTSVTANGTIQTAALSNSDTNGGWTVGAGIESRIYGNWTAKVEYLYIDLGDFNNVVQFATTPGIGARFSSHITDHIARVGLNYKFGGPVIARY